MQGLRAERAMVMPRRWVEDAFGFEGEMGMEQDSRRVVDWEGERWRERL